MAAKRQASRCVLLVFLFVVMPVCAGNAQTLPYSDRTSTRDLAGWSLDCSSDRLTGAATSCSLSSSPYWAVELSGPDKYEKQRVMGIVTGGALVDCDGRVSIVALVGTSSLLHPTRYRLGDEAPQDASGVDQALFTDPSMERVTGKTLAFEAGDGIQSFSWRFEGPSRSEIGSLKGACAGVE